ncbi:proline-rich family protein [Striga asiatica]|uniref:Proline-rich family protein n=1 Tax=Striga asiatica TaxID=4170 RepID=A0A5A7REY5_STRAF|nr:proline-rich family protein [Striga asiatica]
MAASIRTITAVSEPPPCLPGREIFRPVEFLCPDSQALRSVRVLHPYSNALADVFPQKRLLLCQEAGLQAVRKNRYVILAKDFDMGHRSNVKKPDFEFYNVGLLAAGYASALASLTMSRTLRESVIGAGRSNALLNHRRGPSLNGAPNAKDSADDHLDLFSKSRRSLSVASSDESDVPVRLGRLSLGSANQRKSGLEDLLSSAEGGKHDYDWLLTPPGTPLVSSSDGNESSTGLMARRSGPLVRSVSTTKASRLSVSHSENNHASRPTRSSSVTRPSVSSSQYSTYSNNRSASILNTSSASVSSYMRPSTPTNRSSSIARPSTSSRSTTPAKLRPSLSTSSVDKPRPSQSSRPSTPTSTRPQISANSNSTAPRTTSRPSTPTRRNSAPSLSGPSTPGGPRTNGRSSVASISRPSSPGPPRVRTPPQPIPIMLPDFPLDKPPNLRTTLPDRPISAGRSRPKGNGEPPPNNTAAVRRQSSPIVSRGRLAEPTGKGRIPGNGHLADATRELSTRKPVKTSADSTGFGRTISKKSLDMAIRHMDIRNGSNGVRPLTGSNLFPQSIRSTNQKTQPGAAVSTNGSLSNSGNGAIAENIYRFSEIGGEEDKSQYSAKLSNSDIYESSRYDMILLKEDMKNSNWLHSLDDKSDQGSIFDHGFELLPEPFGPL